MFVLIRSIQFSRFKNKMAVCVAVIAKEVSFCCKKCGIVGSYKHFNGHI